MDWLDVVVLFVAGTAAGTINTVVGSGSLITFPALLALGYPPIVANVTNNVGVFPGAVSGAWAYRRELNGRWRRVLPLAAFSFVGGLAGALLLFVLPAAAFDAIVPVLIIAACVLVIAGPWLKRWAESRRADAHTTPVQRLALRAGAGLTGVYGGYFGAAQGVILLALLSILLPGDLNRANAYKNVLAAMANGAAAVVFVFTGRIAWLAALIIAIGAIVGGQLGATIGRRLPAVVYRIVIVLIGVAAVVYFYAK
ncbi:MAG: sulfite exporter TauE/SafE family protein [Microbacteriaceae bacterium]|nr:MAG: sulfite exporter TauE/SafE family protein [Microbacteriaceae bacterium]